MYLEAITSNMYFNLAEEDSDYASKIIKKIKSLNQIRRLDPVSPPIPVNPNSPIDPFSLQIHDQERKPSHDSPEEKDPNQNHELS